MKSVVYARIPKSGLGNCMLVWAHALVFAKMNNLELVTGRWQKFRWGAILRGERKKRFYGGYFKETSLMQLFRFRISTVFHKKYYDPDFKIWTEKGNSLFIFTKISPDRNLFLRLRPYEKFIQKSIIDILTEGLRKKYEKLSRPEIAIHVRRGDFKIANPITTEKFFISAINEIRQRTNSELSVTVFTDADANEIPEILSMPRVTLSANKEDLLDILQMSKSKYLVLSRSSTFSYWAAFLSNATVIMQADDWQSKIKDGNEVGYSELRKAY